MNAKYYLKRCLHALEDMQRHKPREGFACGFSCTEENQPGLDYILIMRFEENEMDIAMSDHILSTLQEAIWAAFDPNYPFCAIDLNGTKVRTMCMGNCRAEESDIISAIEDVAERLHINLEYCGNVKSLLSDIPPSMLDWTESIWPII